MAKKKKITLALQGGGAHGAFTWGFLDKLLETELFTIEGISATSAGSMNAAVLAHGYLQGGVDGARQSLHDFWHAMSDYGKLFGITTKIPLDFFLEPLLKTGINFNIFNTIVDLYSPYQLNPLNIHPIRDVLEKTINIDNIRKKNAIKLFICATNVRTGKIHVFNNKELSIDALLASACLPRLFQAVEIDGELYWDGGYLGNPAIYPLIYDTKCSDILIIHTVPIARNSSPTTVPEIEARLREISFNSSLMREMRAIAFVTNLITEDLIKDEYKEKLKRVFMHCVRADESMSDFSMATVFSPDWDFLLTLRDLGRQEASTWIDKNYDAIGEKTTINFDDWL